MIVSYHPPLFKPMKRLTAENWKVADLLYQPIKNALKLKWNPKTAFRALLRSDELRFPQNRPHLSNFKSRIKNSLISHLNFKVWPNIVSFLGKEFLWFKKLSFKKKVSRINPCHSLFNRLVLNKFFSWNS